MMSFCRQSVNSFLNFTLSKPPWKPEHQTSSREPNGLNLITEVSTAQKSANIVESASVPKHPLEKKPDPCGIMFLDAIDGLTSCTESLGFESSNERLINDIKDEEEEDVGFGFEAGKYHEVRERRKRVVKKKFPPPLSSLNHHGHPRFYLRSVRKEGRLELVEVKIERPEILRAFREDGRLRLNMVTDEEEERESVRERDSGRRCNEVINYHNHHLNMWNLKQHCVTTT